MSHIQQIEFCTLVKSRLPEYFIDKFVLDIGSLDINGNNSYLFTNSHYIGLDVGEGDNVDIICPGHELNLPDATFDVVISTECFEHDRFYPLTLTNIVRLLKPGGLFLFTCATAGRPEHGTRRTSPQDAPLIQVDEEWADYYKNLDEGDIRDCLNLDEIFKYYEFSVNNDSHDLYFFGLKKGDLTGRKNYSYQISQKRNMTGLEAMEGAYYELQSQLIESRGRIDVLRLELREALAASNEVKTESKLTELSRVWEQGTQISNLREQLAAVKAHEPVQVQLDDIVATVTGQAKVLESSLLRTTDRFKDSFQSLDDSLSHRFSRLEALFAEAEKGVLTESSKRIGVVTELLINLHEKVENIGHAQIKQHDESDFIIETLHRKLMESEQETAFLKGKIQEYETMTFRKLMGSLIKRSQ